MQTSEAFKFGLVDGLNGAVGLVIGLLYAGASASIVFVALLARAGSSSVSMAGAQFQTSGDDVVTRKVRWQKVAAMGLGYLTSALTPGLGFAINKVFGLIVFIPSTIIILLMIAKFRAGEIGWPKSLATTLTIFALAVAAGLLASLVAG